MQSMTAFCIPESLDLRILLIQQDPLPCLIFFFFFPFPFPPMIFKETFLLVDLYFTYFPCVLFKCHVLFYPLLLRGLPSLARIISSPSTYSYSSQAALPKLITIAVPETILSAFLCRGNSPLNADRWPEHIPSQRCTKSILLMSKLQSFLKDVINIKLRSTSL